jgi:ubiquinone/menaquinone biosynthesis C-methylase UbiE
MGEWIAYFDSDHPIYVNATHKAAHNRILAAGFRSYVPRSDAVVLDYGCGEAFHADGLAQGCGRLILSDAGPKRLAELRERYPHHPIIEVCTPAEVDALPDHSVDLVILHSVAQYLAHDEIDGMFKLFRRLLRPDGLLLVGDVVPPDSSAAVSALALLRFAAREGFLLAAIGGLIRTVLSGYVALRSRLGLTFYRPDEMIAHLTQAGFNAARAEENIGHDQSRMTFVARPA